MIQSLTLQNFQAHQDTTIEFSPYLTILVGLNDHGKSAVLRGLRKLTRDVPEGNAFVSDWATDMCITAVTDSGHTVSRMVSKGKNPHKYVIDGDEFVKFKETPAEVLPALGISPIQTFGDIDIDLNFQNQLDAPFLVTGNGLASLRGKVLSKATGVDVAQRAAQLAGSKEKSYKAEQKRIEQDYARVASDHQFYTEHLQALPCTVSQAEGYVADINAAAVLLTSICATDEQRRHILDTARVLSAKKKVCTVVLDTPAMRQQLEIIMELENLIRFEQRIQQLEQMLLSLTPDVPLQATADTQQVHTMLSVYADTEYRLAVLDVAKDFCTITVDVPCIFTQVQSVSQLTITNKQAQTESILLLSKAGVLGRLQTNQMAVEKDLVVLQQELRVCPVCNKPFTQELV